VETTEQAASLLEKLEKRTDKQSALLADIKKFRDSSAELAAIDILNDRTPKFFYTSHFERMSGEISLNRLAKDKQEHRVLTGDQIFLDFLEYAGTSVDDLQQTKKYEELKAQCEGASMTLLTRYFNSGAKRGVVGQDRTRRREAEDPRLLTLALFRKSESRASIIVLRCPYQRSAGFVWFFSFIAQFKQLKRLQEKQSCCWASPA
jgi:hypothetical protein